MEEEEGACCPVCKISGRLDYYCLLSRMGAMNILLKVEATVARLTTRAAPLSCCHEGLPE